jgi:hypothetical protein
MSIVWDNLIKIQEDIIKTFELTGTEIQEEGMERFNQPGWINRVWTSSTYRRAHVDVVDMRESSKLWMMHVCVFPHTDSDAPIFGFDVIAGPKKMTGAFCDLSATTDPDHTMIKHFATISSKLKWKRERELPEWAKAIFSDGMIAAGMVKEIDEIKQISDAVDQTLTYYLKELGNHSSKDLDREKVRVAQNRYGYYQRQNPHTPRVMISLGLDPEDVKVFVEKCLFPEIQEEMYKVSGVPYKVRRRDIKL